jgi:ribonuclease VapC
MIVDASAMIAVILKEQGWESFEAALLTSPENLISPVNRMEIFMRLDKLDGDWLVQIFEMLAEAVNLKTEPVDLAQLANAQDAFRRFGKGRHKAALNMGDCFAYALAKSKGQPLLFKGDDFTHTDLEFAL